MTSMFCERGQTGLGVVKLHGRTTECPVCRRIALAYDATSSWCHSCTVSLLAEQEVEMGSFRQEREVVERPDLKVVEDDV